MPVVFRDRGYRFHFFSNEGSPREPQHIHVTRDGIAAKFWLWPDVVVAYNDGFGARVLRELTEIIEHRRDEIARAWDDHFG
ncbi:MAG: DUF4160 domain-containing protein [Rhizobiaceae bacterium]